MPSLNDLPQDVLFNIFSQLICPLVSHDIARAPQNIRELEDAEGYRLRNLTAGTYISNHPYLALAAQCRSLRFAVEDYCQHLMLKRMTIKAARILKPAWSDWSKGVSDASQRGKPVDAKVLRTYRLQYLKWSVETCLFCGKNSKRRAMFNMQMWCCKKCDDTEFGKKISKTEASKKYRVLELHWTYPHILLPASWSTGLDFAFANLPVFQGARMFKEGEIAKLSAELKANPPSRDQILRLKRNDRIREEFLAKYLRMTMKDRDVIRILSRTFDKLLSGELKLPATERTWQRLQDDGRRCEKIMREAMPSRGMIQHWKRYMRWWDHLIPPTLVEHFKLATIKEERGGTRHEMLVRSVNIAGPLAIMRRETDTQWTRFSVAFDHSGFPLFAPTPQEEVDEDLVVDLVSDDDE